jgi:hypothetical protein
MQDSQSIHPLTTPELLGYIFSFCDQKTQTESLPFVSHFWRQTWNQQINQPHWQNNLFNPHIMTRICAFADPLTQQKIFPKVSKCWNTVIQHAFQSSECHDNLKKVSCDLRDFEKHSLRMWSMHGFPHWWNSLQTIEYYKMSLASSLHGRIRNHDRFAPFTKKEAIEHLKIDGYPSCILLTPAHDGRSDCCHFYYVDAHYKIKKVDIKLDYINQCFTIIADQATNENSRFENIEDLIEFTLDKIESEVANIDLQEDNTRKEIIYENDSDAECEDDVRDTLRNPPELSEEKKAKMQELRNLIFKNMF